MLIFKEWKSKSKIFLKRQLGQMVLILARIDQIFNYIFANVAHELKRVAHPWSSETVFLMLIFFSPLGY